MWIRSQNKTRLVKCDFIRVNGNEIQANFSSNSYSVIAKYSSEAKALKVLDEIEKFITLKSYNDNLTVVYQMPQDEDVMVEE